MLHSHNPTQIPRLLDYGANFHAYHQEDHDVVQLMTHRPLGAREPNGSLMHSTKEVTAVVPTTITQHVPQCHFDGHVLPALSQHTTLLIGKFCDAGCKCILQADKAIIIKDNMIIMEGKRSANGLWYLEQERPPAKTCSALSTSSLDRLLTHSRTYTKQHRSKTPSSSCTRCYFPQPNLPYSMQHDKAFFHCGRSSHIKIHLNICQKPARPITGIFRGCGRTCI